MQWCFAIGIVSGILVDLAMEILDIHFHVDDPVGTVAVHCVNGIWGTVAVGLFACNEAYGTKGLSMAVFASSAYSVSVR